MRDSLSLQGTVARPGAPAVLITVQVVNFFASALTVGFWIDKTYNFRIRQWEEYLEYVAQPLSLVPPSAACADPPLPTGRYMFAGLFGVDYLFRTARRGFTLQSCFSKDCLLDVFCAVPLVLQGHIVRSWLSVTYLRSLAVLWSFEELLAMNVNIPFVTSDLRLRLATALLRLLALLFCLAGSMYIFEFLGNPPNLHDSFVHADMGDISFHVMCYFTLVTISTIGYGDFSPSTLLGRTFLLFVILGGVAFFSYETSELLALRALEASGRGSFRPRNPGRPHVLVCGGAVTAGSATLADFLHELCHPLRGTGEDAAPEVVVMSSSEPTPALRKVLARRFALHHVSLLTGSPLVPKDLKRARAASADMALILADLAAADPAAEDEETVLAAAAMHRLFPALPLRCMLIRQDSKRLAITAGLPRASVVAAHELSPRLMALAIRVAGSGALLSNLVRLTPSPRGSPSEAGITQAQGGEGTSSVHASTLGGSLYSVVSTLTASAAAAARSSISAAAPAGLDGSQAAYTTETGAVARHAPRWLREYAFGAAHSLHGVLLGSRWGGMAFHDALIAMFNSHGILLVAVQYDGAVVLNPTPGSEAACLTSGGVAFALGLSAEHVAHAAADDTGGADGRAWRAAYHANAEEARAQAMARTRAEAVARLAAANIAGNGGTQTTFSGMTMTAAARRGAGTPGVASLSSLMSSMQAQQGSAGRGSAGVAAAGPRGGIAPASPGRPAMLQSPAGLGPRRGSGSNIVAQGKGAPGPQTPGHRRGTSSDGSTALPSGGAAVAGGGPGAPVALGTRRRRLRRDYIAEVTAGDKQPLYGEFSPMGDVQSVAETGGHTVLVSLDARPAAWAQVQGILEALRQPFLPDVVPVVVMCTSRPPAKLASRFIGVYYVDALLGGTATAGDIASTDWGTVLIQAGVDTAERVLYLAGEPPTRDEFMIDRRAVLFATLLETYHGEWARDVFAAIELHNPNSVWHLRQSLPTWEAQLAPGMLGAGKQSGNHLSHSLHRRLTALGSVAEAMASGMSPARRTVRLSMSRRLEADSPGTPPGLFRRVTGAVRRALGAQAGGGDSPSPGGKTIQGGGPSRADSLTSVASSAQTAASGTVPGAVLSGGTSTSSRGGQQPVLHARFAAGRVLFRTDVARLFAAAFFTPGVVELLAGLADPVGERQTSQLWRVELGASPLARFATQRMAFSLLLDHCASEGVLPLALLRSHIAEDGSSEHVTSGRSGGGKLPYCVTCPHPASHLRPSDVLFVLAPAEWARVNAPEYEAARLIEAVLAVQAAWRAKSERRRRERARLEREQEADRAKQARFDKLMTEAETTEEARAAGDLQREQPQWRDNEAAETE